jgi:ABC-type ATPase involved in cell division
VQYFPDCVGAARAAARRVWWDLALIDGIDRVQTDAERASALARVLARARAESTALLLAAREASAVQEWSDRIVTLQHGRVVHPAGAAIARVAEHAGPLTVIPSAPSIR